MLIHYTRYMADGGGSSGSSGGAATGSTTGGGTGGTTTDGTPGSTPPSGSGAPAANTPTLDGEMQYLKTLKGMADAAAAAGKRVVIDRDIWLGGRHIQDQVVVHDGDNPGAPVYHMSISGQYDNNGNQLPTPKPPWAGRPKTNQQHHPHQKTRTR